MASHARSAAAEWSLRDTYGFIATFLGAKARRPLHGSRTTAAATLHVRSISSTREVTAPIGTKAALPSLEEPQQPQAVHRRRIRRGFHNYFVTHLPSSSLHPDSSRTFGPHHKLPRSAAAPHKQSPGSVPAASPLNVSPARELTVVRIPLRSAKHHLGVAVSRGSRPYNEDSNQAGTIDMPAFAKRAPISLVRSSMKKSGEATPADSSFGDPQVFYFAVFDGHGGTQCSDFLRDELHGYIEEAADEFELKSTLRPVHKTGPGAKDNSTPARNAPNIQLADAEAGGEEALERLDMKSPEEVKPQADIPTTKELNGLVDSTNPDAIEGDKPQALEGSVSKALRLQKELVKEYRDTIGGYFKRFSPPHFNLHQDPSSPESLVSIESVLTYAFLRADLDFVTAQATKPDPDDPYLTDSAVNDDEVLGKPHHIPPSGHGIGGRSRFKGGSTASIALISTPTPAPFWHPAAHSTLVVGHVGDTRILLCETATGLAKPLTSDHHPSAPGESHRLRRFATSFVADSFGEERIQGLANSRAFGDIGSKRLGVSAEPELTRTELGPAEYSFMVLMSDGISGTLSDQEIVDVVKEAKTPEQGSRDVVAYATEVSEDGDNATCLVVRLGGWERRSEGGLGSLGTKEIRDFRRNEANDPRRGRR